jgi:hypothetical protein
MERFRRFATWFMRFMQFMRFASGLNLPVFLAMSARLMGRGLWFRDNLVNDGVRIYHDVQSDWYPTAPEQT